MANTNIFKKHLNVFIKNKKQKTVIQRENDCYYICDGYTMLKLPAVFYDGYARTISPIFPALENGQSATRRPGEMLAELDPPSNSMIQIYQTTKAEKPVTITDLFYITDQNKMLRYVNIDGAKIRTYNNDFISAMLEYAQHDQLRATADRFPALKWDDPDMQVGCLVLPVNSDSALTQVVDVAEVLRK